MKSTKMSLFTLPGKPCPYHHLSLTAHFRSSLCFLNRSFPVGCTELGADLGDACIALSLELLEGELDGDTVLTRLLYGSRRVLREFLYFLTSLLAEVLTGSSRLQPLTCSRLFS